MLLSYFSASFAAQGLLKGSGVEDRQLHILGRYPAHVPNANTQELSPIVVPFFVNALAKVYRALAHSTSEALQDRGPISSYIFLQRMNFVVQRMVCSSEYSRSIHCTKIRKPFFNLLFRGNSAHTCYSRENENSATMLQEKLLTNRSGVHI